MSGAAGATAAALPNNTTAAYSAASAAAAAVSGATPALTAPGTLPGVLPAWTGLPHPPLWLKPDDRLLTSTSKPASPGLAIDASLESDGARAATAATAGAGAEAEGVDAAGAWSGVGEKMPRLEFVFFCWRVEFCPRRSLFL